MNFRYLSIFWYPILFTLNIYTDVSSIFKSDSIMIFFKYLLQYKNICIYDVWIYVNIYNIE